ncbi:hypothetical protein Trydic_g2280, partial [Trypoxylus dichotomus]
STITMMNSDFQDDNHIPDQNEANITRYCDSRIQSTNLLLHFPCLSTDFQLHSPFRISKTRIAATYTSCRLRLGQMALNKYLPRRQVPDFPFGETRTSRQDEPTRHPIPVRAPPDLNIIRLGGVGEAGKGSVKRIAKKRMWKRIVGRMGRRDRETFQGKRWRCDRTEWCRQIWPSSNPKKSANPGTELGRAVNFLPSGTLNVIPNR